MERLSKQTPMFIAIVTMMATLTLLPSDIYVAAMPSMESFFATTIRDVQLTMSAFLLGAAISQVVAGPLVDRFNYKVVSVAALGVFTLMSALCVVSPTIDLLIGYRFVQALAAGFAVVASRAIVVKTSTRDESTRIFLIMSPILAISPGVAPILGGYLAHWFSWQASFAFITLFGVFLVAGVAVKLPNPGAQADGHSIHPKNIAATYLRIFGNPNFSVYLFLRSMIDASYFAYITASPFIFAGMGYSVDRIGLFYVLIAASYILVAHACKRLVTPTNADRLIAVGLWISVIGTLMLYVLAAFHINNVYAVIIPAAVMTGGYGFSGPLSWTEALNEFPNDAGYASSLIGFCPLAAAALAAAFVNSATRGNVGYLAIFLMALLAIGIVAHSLLVTRWRLRWRLRSDCSST